MGIRARWRRFRRRLQGMVRRRLRLVKLMMEVQMWSRLWRRMGIRMVERRARAWKHREYVVLFEAYLESLVESDNGWQVRISDGWVRKRNVD